MNISRRNILKGIGLGTAAAALPSIAKPVAPKVTTYNAVSPEITMGRMLQESSLKAQATTLSKEDVFNSWQLMAGESRRTKDRIFIESMNGIKYS